MYAKFRCAPLHIKKAKRTDNNNNNQSSVLGPAFWVQKYFTPRPSGKGREGKGLNRKEGGKEGREGKGKEKGGIVFCSFLS